MRTNSDIREKHPENTIALIERALSGDHTSVEALVHMLTPVIRYRSGRVLGRAARGRNIAVAVDDIVQHVLLVLFADQGKVLRSWDPERRLPLVQFIGLVAER